MATIKEVAQRAKVSIATVSYVLNGTGAVSANKRRAVMEAVDALNYRPSYRGRALQSRRSMSLGLVLPASRRAGDPSFSTLLGGLVEGAARHGYHVLLAASGPDQPEAMLYGSLYRSGMVDGIVIIDAQVEDERSAVAEKLGLPLICAGRSSNRTAFVALDGVAGMIEALAHLIVRGH